MDYGKRINWLFRPPEHKLKHGTDVFFVYPTVSGRPGKKKNHNMNPYNPVWRLFAFLMTLWRGRYLTDDCNMFAPHYRQTGIESLEMKGDELRHYFELAYSDVRDAFYYYMENLNGGRPFILAGHSQGSAMLLELLCREFSGGKFDSGFVAAYLIGFSVTEEDLVKFPHVRLVRGEDDTGGVISYNTSAEGLKLMRIVVRKDAVCVNPLNFVTTADYAPRQANLGFVLFDFGGRFVLEYKHFTGAYIDVEKGVVMIDKDALNTLLNIKIGFLNRILISSRSLHFLDTALFHRNLQNNARLRIEKFNEAKRA